jgi:hypothetical protein
MYALLAAVYNSKRGHYENKMGFVLVCLILSDPLGRLVLPRLLSPWHPCSSGTRAVAGGFGSSEDAAGVMAAVSTARRFTSPPAPPTVSYPPTPCGGGDGRCEHRLSFNKSMKRRGGQSPRVACG